MYKSRALSLDLPYSTLYCGNSETLSKRERKITWESFKKRKSFNKLSLLDNKLLKVSKRKEKKKSLESVTCQTRNAFHPSADKNDTLWSYKENKRRNEQYYRMNKGGEG